MIAQSVAEIVKRHVTLTVEGIDRMYRACNTNTGSTGSFAIIAGSPCRRRR